MKGLKMGTANDKTCRRRERAALDCKFCRMMSSLHFAVCKNCFACDWSENYSKLILLVVTRFYLFVTVSCQSF